MTSNSRLIGLKRQAKDEGWSEWIRSEADEKAMLKGCYFDIEAANRPIVFFEKYLRHAKGRWAGKPFIPLEWQRQDVIMPIFGWKRRNGYRRYRVVYIEIPKKNGKSTLLSGIGLYLLTKDGEQGAEVYSCAADRDQASIIYLESENMAKASPALKKRLKIISSRSRIIFPQTNSFYRALSADANTKEGYNVHGLLFDELHAQKDSTLWDTLRYSGASRTQPLLITITTAGYNRQSICWEQHDYARKILKGVIDDMSFFPLIYSTNWEDAENDPDIEEDDWTDPEVWKKANPSLGETIDLDVFAEECAEAQEIPRKQNTFKRYRLDIWTGAETAWIPVDRWRACKGEPDLAKLSQLQCWGGFDLSTTTDLTAFSIVFEPDENGHVWVLSWAWCPKDTMESRIKRDKVPYDTWEQQGYLIVTGGSSVDYNSIEKFILEEIKEKFPRLTVLGYDPWNATQFAQNLEEEGVPVVPVRQGYKTMSPACKELERLVLGGHLRHGDNPVLNWAMSNVMIEMDAAENIKPTKAKSTERIDPAVSMLTAMATMMEFGEDDQSIYETRGLIVI
jgi:phage terminase large subunit-like protein